MKHTLVHAFIASFVDYCNALLYGVAGGVIRRLQSVLPRCRSPASDATSTSHRH